jgi:hypothetical protein
MPDFTVVETRSISGKGVLQIPDANRLDRAFILYSDVARKPTSESKNFNYNPAKSFYGKICLMNNDYVVAQISIEFESQRWDFIPDVNAETLLAVQCAYKGLLQTFSNLATALAGTPGGIGLHVTSIDNNIIDYAPIRNSWSSLQLVCYADTGIQLSLQSLAPDQCGTDSTPPIPPAEPPPPKPTPVPPGQPFQNSPPYAPSSGNPNVGDAGNTQPLPLDESHVFICTLTFQVRRSDLPSYLENASVNVPNNTYTSAYVDIVSHNSDGTYTYYARTAGSLGIITLSGPFNPQSSVEIIYSNFSVSCV